jgi:type I restriction enzyme, S subunit
MSAETKVPVIRFKGFRGEWEEKILGELVKLENGFAFKSKYFKKEPTDVIVLTPGSVSVGGGFQHGKGQYYDVKQDVPEKYVFKSGDMFITMTDLTPTAQALGFPALVPSDDNKYLHNQRLGKLIDFNGSLEFLFHLFCTQKKQKEVVLTSSGTTVKHTSPTKFLNRYCFFPKKTEQTKIGNYFQQLDTLIAQHQQKHDKLLNLKKALLEKMFPKQSAKVPNIRFKGFSGEWGEQCWLETVDISTDMVDPRNGMYDELFHIGPGNIESFSGKIYDNVLAVKDSYLISGKFYFNKGDIIYGKINPQLAKYIIAPFEGLASADAYVLNTKNGVVQNYLYVILQTKDFYKYSVSVSARTGMPKINRDELNVYKYKAPDETEQTKIGSLFKSLDVLINQHQAQLKKLNNIKQACLEKIFV